MHKPGVKTTEFWMHIALQIILLLNTTQAWTFMPPKYSAAAQTILAAAYAIARGLSKMNVTGSPGDQANYPPIEPPGDTTS